MDFLNDYSTFNPSRIGIIAKDNTLSFHKVPDSNIIKTKDGKFLFDPSKSYKFHNNTVCFFSQNPIEIKPKKKSKIARLRKLFDFGRVWVGEQ